jgi:hypothetical protein
VIAISAPDNVLYKTYHKVWYVVKRRKGVEILPSVEYSKCSTLESILLFVS